MVRQIGSQNIGAQSELLLQDDVYLLYVTESGLEGELAQQYYVTGANAGIYISESGKPSSSVANPTQIFAQFSPQEGESLPVKMSLADAGGRSSSG